ncbi:hypothetical protein CHUAL_005066 [Chamberlinius hualienensis]
MYGLCIHKYSIYFCEKLETPQSQVLFFYSRLQERECFCLHVAYLKAKSTMDSWDADTIFLISVIVVVIILLWVNRHVVSLTDIFDAFQRFVPCGPPDLNNYD